MSKPITHGTQTGYSRGCRCEGCREGHRTYNRERKRRISRYKQGLGPEPESRQVSPDEARNHLLFLHSKGVSINAIADRTGLSEETLKKIRGGRSTFIFPSTEAAILSVASCHVGSRQLVSSDFAQQVVAALREIGLTMVQINQLMGRAPQPSPLIHGKWMRIETRDRWERLYLQVFRHPAPFEKSDQTKMAHDLKNKS